MANIAQLVHRAAAQLQAAAGADASLEAEVLLTHVMGIDRAHLLARLTDEASDSTQRNFDALIARRVAREPLAYIIGHREFYGIDLVCRAGALIPRPETELLVDLALEEIDRRGNALRIIDVGAGSGAIAVAIVASATGVHVVASDTSDAALAVASENVRRHDFESRISVHWYDLLDGAGTFDVIVANLPYVSAAEWETLQPEIRDHEPRAALVGGARGTEVVEELLEQAPQHLAPGGVLCAEIGETQAGHLLAVAGRFFPDARSYVMKDFAGKDRVLVIRREGEGIE